MTLVMAPRRSYPSPLPVLEHCLVSYRRTWRGSVLTTFVVPVLFLLGLGVSLGAYVDRSGTLGVRYLDFIAPGLLASSTMQVAINQSTWPILGSFEWQRRFFAMQATPLRPADILGGEALYIVARACLAAIGFLVAMAAFGTLHSWWTLAAVPASLLLSAAASMPVLAFAASIRTDNMFALLNRFAVIPMTLFAGVFFPVAAMPAVARGVAYASPLWHGVELCRAATLGTATAAPIWLHVGYLGLWIVAGYACARSRFVSRLAV